MKKYLSIIISLYLIVSLTQCKSNLTSGDTVFIENGKIRLGFDKNTGKFVSFSDVNNSYEFIERTAVNELPSKVNIHQSTGTKPLSVTPSKYTYSTPTPLTLVLRWEKFEGMDDFCVEATVTIDAHKALSYWNIKTEGITGMSVENLVFPQIQGIKDLGNEKLAIPTWMGSLINNPRDVLGKSNATVKQMNWSYPGSLSMQVVTRRSVKRWSQQKTMRIFHGMNCKNSTLTLWIQW